MVAHDTDDGPGPRAELLLTSEIDTADAIVAVLADAGVEVVFGIPGGYTGAVFGALHGHPSIRVVQVREESIGSAAAEAYGRLTGRPAVLMGQGEWISGNAGQGLLEALLGSSPVVVLTEMSDGGPLSHHGPYQGGTGDHGAWDARSALGGISKRVFTSATPAQAVQHTQLALKHAGTGEPGPVTVIYEGRSLKGTVGPDSRPRLFRTAGYLHRPRSYDAAAIEAAAADVASSRRPVIVAGNGVRVGQACAALARLAEAIDCPVTTSASGKGVFPEAGPLAGGVIGTFGHPSANALVAQADLVLAVGTKLGPIDTGDENPLLIDPLRQVLVQVDVEPLNAGWTHPVDHALVGEAGVVMDRLGDVLAGRAPGGGARRVAEARAAHDEPRFADGEADAPIHPELVIRALDELWPDDGIVTCDAGENRLFMMHWFRTKLPGGYLQPAAGGGMGYAIPAAIGAKLAEPDRPVLAVLGDGGFSMTIAGLMTALEERVPIVVVVLNNNALGWVVHGMGEKALTPRSEGFDFAAVARSLGCDGVRVESTKDLREVLERAPATAVPLVIDVPTSMEVSFKDIVQDVADARWRHSD